MTDEAVQDGCDNAPRMVCVIDVADESRPRVRAVCPVPQGDFCDHRLRFGAHNLHENRPGSYRSERIAFVTYFNAGLRVYDLADPRHRAEMAHWIPACPPGQQAAQINDVWVGEDTLGYVSNRINGGVYVLEPASDLAARLDQAGLPQETPA